MYHNPSECRKGFEMASAIKDLLVHKECFNKCSNFKLQFQDNDTALYEQTQYASTLKN